MVDYEQFDEIKSVSSLQFPNELAILSDKVVDQIYAWQFKEALQSITELRANYPDSLVPDLLEIGTLFWLYIAASNAEEDARGKLLFTECLERTKKRFDDKLSANPNDMEAIYVMAFAEGSQSKFYAIEADWFKAYRFGVKGYGRLRDIEKVNALDFETQFGIGLYKYYCATYLPKWFQKLSWMVPGIDVDRKGGFERLKLSTKYAKIMKIEAEMSVAQAYGYFEREYDLSLTQLRTLYQKYPGNYVLNHTLGACLYFASIHYRNTGKSEKGLKLLKEALKHCQKTPKFRMVLKKKDYIRPHFKWKLEASSDHELTYGVYKELGEILFLSDRWKESKQILLDGASLPHLPENLRSALYIHLAYKMILLDKPDYQTYLKESIRLSGEKGELAEIARTLLGKNYKIDPVEIEMMNLKKKLVLGKANLKDIQVFQKGLSQEKQTLYKYEIYSLQFPLLQENGEVEEAEKLHDYVRFHSQVER